MFRLNGIVLSIATLLAAGPVLAASEASLIDQLDGADSGMVFKQYPDLVRFTTIGSPDGERFASMADETAAAITRAQTMMSDVDTDWSDVIELKILTTSETDRAEAARLVADDPRLSALQVSYRVVGQLSAPRARVGLDLVVRSERAILANARLYGQGSSTSK